MTSAPRRCHWLYSHKRNHRNAHVCLSRSHQRAQRTRFVDCRIIIVFRGEHCDCGNWFISSVVQPRSPASLLVASYLLELITWTPSIVIIFDHRDFMQRGCQDTFLSSPVVRRSNESHKHIYVPTKLSSRGTEQRTRDAVASRRKCCDVGAHESRARRDTYLAVSSGLNPCLSPA